MNGDNKRWLSLLNVDLSGAMCRLNNPLAGPREPPGEPLLPLARLRCGPMDAASGRGLECRLASIASTAGEG